VGITSFNLKLQIPNDIPEHNQYIPADSLKSQKWLDDINKWTINQKMLINQKKTKCMVFNYTDHYKFTTRLQLNDETVEVIDSTRLLGTIITKDLKWDLNTQNIVKKANARMQLIRKVASFGTSPDELKNVYILFIRSLLEQSAVVWHSSLTQENIDDLERVQKSAVRIILGDMYIGYKKSLEKLDMETLYERREQICLNFAKACVKNPKFSDMFPKNIKTHAMETRNPEIFNVNHANNERFKKSSIIYMQHLLNEDQQKVTT
jgi:hypothetical protein